MGRRGSPQCLVVDGVAVQERDRIADPKDLLCPTGKCRYRADDGQLLYRDGNHLTKAGTRFVAPVLDQCFAGIVAPTTGAAPSR